MNLIPYESKQQQMRRYDVAMLRQELEMLDNEIALFYRAQYAFEREYQNRLGDLAEAVVALRAELGMTEVSHSFAIAATELTDNDRDLLKGFYRKAAKLCHPDYLPNHLREMGLQLFDNLNKAYHLQDLVQVEHILWLLQSGQAFSKTTVVIKCPVLLLKRKKLLNLLIMQKTDQLEQLRRSEEYDISHRDNWNILLYDYQTQLEDELAMLRARKTV